jgi:hypothetical protein
VKLRFEPYTEAIASGELDELQRHIRGEVRRLAHLGAEARHHGRLRQLDLVPEELVPDVLREFDDAEQMAQRWAHDALAGTRASRPLDCPSDAKVASTEASGDDARPRSKAMALSRDREAAPLTPADLVHFVDLFRRLDAWKKEAP